MIVKIRQKLNLSIFLHQEIYFFGRILFVGRRGLKFPVPIPSETL